VGVAVGSPDGTLDGEGVGFAARYVGD